MRAEERNDEFWKNSKRHVEGFPAAFIIESKAYASPWRPTLILVNCQNGVGQLPSSPGVDPAIPPRRKRRTVLRKQTPLFFASPIESIKHLSPFWAKRHPVWGNCGLWGAPPPWYCSHETQATVSPHKDHARNWEPNLSTPEPLC